MTRRTKVSSSQAILDFFDPEHPDLYLYAIVSQSAFLLTHCLWKRTWEIYHSVIQLFQILMLGILNKTLWSVPIYTPKVPKIVPVFAGTKNIACTAERTIRICFAEAHLHHLSSMGPGDSNMARTWCCIPITWFSSSRFLVFGTEDRPALAEFVKTCRHQRRRCGQNMLKFSKFASFRSTKLQHLTSQLCLL